MLHFQGGKQERDERENEWDESSKMRFNSFLPS